MVARVAAAILFFAISVAAAAQPAARVYRIGFVTPLSATPEPPTLRALREGLRELGYIEGKNVVIEARFADGRNERLPELAAELVGLKPDVLVAGSDLGGKRLALLKEAIPGISHIAPLQNSTSPIGGPYVGETQSAARALYVKVDVFNAGNAADLEFEMLGLLPSWCR